MADDLTPTEPKSAIELFTERLNLPHMIAGPAGKAISRLVAGVVDIPAAYLDSFVQGIKDKTEARTLVNREVAEAASKLAAGDSDIVARAAHNLLAKEYRKQKNKEDISRKTLEILEAEAKALPPPTAENTSPPPPDVDPDWLNVFEKYAEDASTERMQNVWARILAGEIRRPKAFSLATLRFIAEVDERTASLFKKYASMVMAHDFIPHPETQGAQFSEMLELQNSGLLMGVGGTIQKIFNMQPGQLPLAFKTELLLVLFDKQIDLRFPAVLLTRTGKELYAITDCAPGRPTAEAFTAKVDKNGIATILYLKQNHGAEVLWKKEEPTPAQPPPN